jgi:hypothetical protein
MKNLGFTENISKYAAIAKEIDGLHDGRTVRYSVYLIYEYKSANTDAVGGRLSVRKTFSFGFEIVAGITAK